MSSVACFVSERQSHIVPMQATQERLSLACLGGLLALIVSLHGYLAFCQIHQPWSTKQAAYFIGLPVCFLVFPWI